MNNESSGAVGVAVAIAVVVTSILVAAIATSPRELVVIFGDLKIEYRQF